MAGEDDDFKTQLELEALEKQQAEHIAASESDPYVYTDPNDGTVYEWDHSKQAWFPKIDENFIASYQANYQYHDASEDTKPKETEPPTGTTKQDAASENKGIKRKANEPAWFDIDDAHNTNVYVSGLPLDTTEEEFVELMSKCGLIMKHPDTMKYKIKLYRNDDGTLKGDGRCCYIKVESVGLALEILDGYLFRNKQISVQRAQFQLKGAYDPSKKPKKKKQKEKEKLKKKLDKLFDWRPDKMKGMRSRNEKTVIIKNMFDPKDFEEDASLILEYQKDLRDECSKCGDVKKVVVYDRNPEGVVSVSFAEPEMADQCVSLMNGRWFAGRQLTAETWDGKTKYKITETEEERQKRLKEWESFLEGSKAKSASSGNTENTDKSTTISQERNQTVPDQDAYEKAGETESSGDSDNEKEPGVTYPVMNASGSFSYERATNSGSDS